MDDEKAVAMTTDAKPLPLSAEEVTAARMLSPRMLTKLEHRLLATIAQQAEQIAELREAANAAEPTDYLESRDGHMNALKGDAIAMRETIKTALCVLRAAEHGQSWSINMVKDFNIAIGMCRAALTPGGPT